LENNESARWDYNDELQRLLVSCVIEMFDLFKSESLLPSQCFGLDPRLVTLAMTNAVTDMKRSVDYHSKSGPSIFKVAGFAGRWVAHQRPVWVDPKRPINLYSAVLDSVNSIFATFVTQGLLNTRIYPKLASDLRYCFEYRRMTGDDVALLLGHALKWSRSA
jgi:hypothetical protein